MKNYMNDIFNTFYAVCAANEVIQVPWSNVKSVIVFLLNFT